MLTDCWLPRMYVAAQIVVVAVCGVLIGTGHNSVVTDLFIAAGGGLVLTEGYNKLTARLRPAGSTGTGSTGSTGSEAEQK